MSEHACTCEHPKQEPGYFCGPNCGPGNDIRHPKWQRVEPGTVIPAGQPYRIEWKGATSDATASEFCHPTTRITTPQTPIDDYFVDSTWRPPLELPTEVGSVIEARCGGDLRKWFLTDGGWLSTDDFGVGSDDSLRDVRVLFDAGAAR